MAKVKVVQLSSGREKTMDERYAKVLIKLGHVRLADEVIEKTPVQSDLLSGDIAPLNSVQNLSSSQGAGNADAANESKNQAGAESDANQVSAAAAPKPNAAKPKVKNSAAEE